MIDQPIVHGGDVMSHGTPSNRAGSAVGPKLATYGKVMIVIVAALMGLVV